MLFEKERILENKKSICFEENVLMYLNSMISLQEICLWMEQFQKNVCQILEETFSGRGERLIQTAIRYIEEHYEKRITLLEISEMLGISAGYFSSLFSQKMGKTFSDYVNWVKICHAKRLLEEHQYLVYEVAEMLGFENAYYFSRVFKKVTGMTPTEYEGLIGAESEKNINR
jgi:two-component system response regulator YesN